MLSCTASDVGHALQQNYAMKNKRVWMMEKRFRETCFSKNPFFTLNVYGLRVIEWIGVVYFEVCLSSNWHMFKNLSQGFNNKEACMKNTNERTQIAFRPKQIK